MTGMKRPPSTPDENSLAAAESVKPTSAQQRMLILSLIRAHAPIAEWELETLAGLPGNSVRPRIWELMQDGLIERCGKNRTPSGRQAWIYQGAAATGAAAVAPTVSPLRATAVPTPRQPVCPKCGNTFSVMRDTLSPSVKQGRCPAHSWQTVHV